MEKQLTDTILMIEPVAFGFNDQTAVNNYFQQNDQLSPSEIQRLAHDEFICMVQTLESNGIHVIVKRDSLIPVTPDSIFPNNWITFHEGGKIVIYPMFAPNRRTERSKEVIGKVIESGFKLTENVDYSSYENENIFLEGTGSMILDRENRIAYAALSERTNEQLFRKFCNEFSYKPVCFHANQTVNGQRMPVYHTNVMLCVGDKFVVVCHESIDDEHEREMLCASFKTTGKELISISEQQMHHFAGNMLQLQNRQNEKLLIMSQSSFEVLSPKQLASLSKYNRLISIAVPTIEKYGGGSVRCMMAEVF